jgi:multiple sugar transport system substrate-binding protein
MVHGVLHSTSAASFPGPSARRADGTPRARHRCRATSRITMPSILRALAFAAAAWAAATASATTTITVATFPDLDRAAKAALPRWHQAHPDVDVKIVSLQYADHHTAMTTALATGSGLPDVMAIDFKFIGKFAGSGGFEDLNKPPYNAGTLRSQFVGYTFTQATNAAGELAALPADIGPGTLLYRSDLVAKAGLTEADLTKSWESFIAAGVKLKAATGASLLADSEDIVDIVMRSNLPAGEGIYFDRQGKVLVDSPRFVRAFELGRAAHKAGIDAGTTMWTNEWVAGFRSNKIAGQMMGAWLAGHLKNWLAPDTAGKWRSAPLPAGAYASYGGSFYAIPKKAAHKAEAWAFVRFMTADKQSQVDSLRTLDTFPALLAAQQDPVIDEPMPFLGGQKARELWRDIAAKVPSIPVDKYDSMATDVIRAEYQNVITQGKDIPTALADAKSLIAHRARR